MWSGLGGGEGWVHRWHECPPSVLSCLQLVKLCSSMIEAGKAYDQAGMSTFQLPWVLAANSSQVAPSLQICPWLNWSLLPRLGSCNPPSCQGQ